MYLLHFLFYFIPILEYLGTKLITLCISSHWNLRTLLHNIGVRASKKQGVAHATSVFLLFSLQLLLELYSATFLLEIAWNTMKASQIAWKLSRLLWNWLFLNFLMKVEKRALNFYHWMATFRTFPWKLKYLRKAVRTIESYTCRAAGPIRPSHLVHALPHPLFRSRHA